MAAFQLITENKRSGASDIERRGVLARPSESGRRSRRTISRSSSWRSATWLAPERADWPALAETAQLNREHLYRMLSESGNPELRSLEALLERLGVPPERRAEGGGLRSRDPQHGVFGAWRMASSYLCGAGSAAAARDSQVWTATLSKRWTWRGDAEAGGSIERAWADGSDTRS